MTRATLLAALVLLLAGCASTPPTGPGGLHVGDGIEFDAPVDPESTGAAPGTLDGMGWSRLLTVTKRGVVAGWKDGEIVLEGDVHGMDPVDLDEVELKSVSCPHR